MCGIVPFEPHCQYFGAFAPVSPSLRERLSWPVIPERNSGEKPASTSGATPSACNPSAVKATCRAVRGVTGKASALDTGAAASHARAAAGSLIFTSRNEASVRLW